ncbi:hypothetical protein [Pseudoxanthomonas sacheonensis]|uniref:hypothetical protein n=1 Tax=Pseudoxanthomonas sacheonensis TaxID=443615 RepID=UPI0013D6046C|nr:hypothetical protein [Pseudoxanthomonas sacheonensis]KAF1709501.1 hypothetical protein CSC73_06095 [Pseudoxanthomonas sacheonensis]
METSRACSGSLLSLALLAVVAPHPAAAQAATATNAPAPEAQRDGQHDFDFEIGTWRTQLKRLVDPLSGSKTWVEYEGTTVVRKILGGRANLVELDVQGPAGRIEGLSLRLYDPQARQWSLNFSNIKSGTLSPPSIGSFSKGRGEFYSKESMDGREILVRFVISGVTADSCHFEQAYSADGGKTWEVNWIADDSRITGRR